MKLIALCGAAGAGKDTVADMLPTRKLAFADALYAEVAAAFGVPVEWLKDRGNKESPQSVLRLCDTLDGGGFEAYLEGRGVLRDDRDASMSRSPRQILQWWGDYRRAQDPDYFVQKVHDAICVGNDETDGTNEWVISDCRLPKEAEMVRQLDGEIWQVVRPGVTAGGTGHSSDTDGSQFSPDRVILNDGTLEDLRMKLEGL